MEVTKSPWLAELNRTRKVDILTGDIATDVIIVGGGISGIVTAYYILHNTKYRVQILEATQVAHGATGHNAGQLATYFERPFFELAQDMGIQKAEEGKEAVESAWELLDEIQRTAKLQTPIWTFTGWAGIRGLDELSVRLKNRRYREAAGTPQQPVFVAKEAEYVSRIPAVYAGLYTLLPQDDILALLETNNREFTAALPSRKGCMNSALFTEELAGFLLARFPERFSVAEFAPVKRVVLKQDHALAVIGSHVVSGRYVVLCTNGFEGFTIVNTIGPDINTSFHHAVRGIVGFMAGYTDALNLPPTAISFLPKLMPGSLNDAVALEPYYYLTRRPFELNGQRKNLICVGGPERMLPSSAPYGLQDLYPETAQLDIDRFLHKNYRFVPDAGITYSFRGHGLMGYTPTGVRLAGFEPCNKHLLYNLGCNGVGILPSMYGGFRIGKLLAGEKLPSSIFDPQDIRMGYYKKRHKVPQV